ncbi:LOW QUALITY PROTEIN: DBH-like monooxygenase protein 2 homolog [Salvelinus alpinus]
MIHIFFSLLLAWTQGTGAHLDPENNVNLKWGFSDVQNTITFQLTVKTTGWVGFGLSPNGGAGADIVIGGVGRDSNYFKLFKSDYHATGNGFPLVDEKQSYTLLSLIEADGQTTMTFWRSIQSCDQEDFHITDSPVKLIYAYGKTDDIEYHSRTRGTKEVNLLKFMPRSSPRNTNYLDFVMDHFIVPAEHTYYNCKVMKMPKLNGKHHVYRVEPVIKNLDLVHHMLLYSCPLSAFELPENAGIPIGGHDYDEFYRLEIHYNNLPSSLSPPAGRRDSSGMRLYYTDQLRQHDVGIRCSIMPLISIMLHTHLAGRKVRVGLFRNGTQIDFLAVDENYNFEMQGFVNLATIKTIKPGDEIVLECTYNTATREGITQLGLATTEMCLAFIIYYPAISVDHCWSQPNMHAYTAMMGKTDYQGIVEMLKTKAWDQASTAVHEATMKKVPQIGLISNEHVSSHSMTMLQHPNLLFILLLQNNYTIYEGSILNMMATPSVCCRSDPTGLGL